MRVDEQIAGVASAATELVRFTENQINAILIDTAKILRKECSGILEANAIDLERMDSENPKYDRLKLTADRIRSIADDIEHVATLVSPTGEVMESFVRPNGMRIDKVRIPFGVIGVIYEARPNVTADVFSLCLKSGNACLLKGGSDAEHTNRKIVELIHKVLNSHGVNDSVCTLLPSDREATSKMLNAVGKVDLIIPRGSSNLINYVRENAKVPVIETGAGICHTYFDLSGSIEKGAAIIKNAKTRRVSVCNALDCLIIHKDRLADLPALCMPLAEKNVIVYADSSAYNILSGVYPDNLLLPATEEHYGTEFLDYKMSIRSVENIDQALAHIAKYSSRHSECIISNDNAAVSRFQKEVDAACVYANVSTAFTDGAQFGFGAEIGISTQKLHARGPMALKELTTYKYLVSGDGQIRQP